ncbi:response regulator [Phenylobacterium sp.]|uniref:response regulator n=1 Tax=Phenylobacterium sp. TaxID=1871053 RepID=UPI00301DF21B
MSGAVAGRGAVSLPRTGGARRQDILDGARILVVEDEFLVAALLEDVLRSFGCDVVGPAATVEEALALLDTQEIDAAVLDVNIAGTPVFPVADALTERDLPLVFATAYGAAGVAQRHSGRAVLDKPYHARALEHALRSALQTRRRP